MNEILLTKRSANGPGLICANGVPECRAEEHKALKRRLSVHVKCEYRLLTNDGKHLPEKDAVG
jgi:hypothetical protein